MYKFLSSTLLPIICSTLLFSNCSTTKIPDPDLFTAVEAELAEVQPTPEELSGEKVKVAVYDVKDINETSERASVGAKVTEQIKNYLLEANVEIVDREAAGKYQDEIILASDQSGTFEGPKFAAYVIQGKLSNTTFSVAIDSKPSSMGIAGNALSYYQKGKLSGQDTTEEICRYKSAISGNFTLYSLPDLTVVKQFQFADEETLDTDPQRGVGSAGDAVAAIFTGKVPATCPVNMNTVDKLANSAASEAVRKNRIEIQNFFAPKAYIEQVMQLDDLFIAKITAGKNSGIKEGQKIGLYTIRIATSNLTGNINKEEKKIAEAIVSNQLGNNYAWIILKKEDSGKIKIGDFVKTIFEKGSFEEFGDILG